jgi:hypothetical protein
MSFMPHTALCLPRPVTVYWHFSFLNSVPGMAIGPDKNGARMGRRGSFPARGRHNQHECTPEGRERRSRNLRGTTAKNAKSPEGFPIGFGASMDGKRFLGTVPPENEIPGSGRSASLRDVRAPQKSAQLGPVDSAYAVQSCPPLRRSWSAYAAHTLPWEQASGPDEGRGGTRPYHASKELLSQVPSSNHMPQRVRG